MGRPRVALVQSKIGKKIFFTFLLITAAPLICISVLSRELSDFVLQKSTDQLLRDSTKSVALNLLDRLRGAEAILRIVENSALSGNANTDATLRAERVFSSIRHGAPAGVSSFDKPRITVAMSADDWPEVAMEIASGTSGERVIGVLDRTYLWENLESAYYTLCVGGEEFPQPHCQGPERPLVSTIEVERPFYFRPYFEGNPWTLVAIAAPDITDYLPVKLTALFAYVAAASLLLALTVSAFFIRRATTPLDALMAATKAIRNRDFTHIVPTSGMRDEFRDVAESFNVMSATIGQDVAFMRALARIDEAILAHRSIATVIQISLGHLSLKAGFVSAQVLVIDYFSGLDTVYRIEGPGRITVANGRGADEERRALQASPGQPICKTDTLAAYFRLPESAVDTGPEALSQVEAFKARIAIGINAEEHEKVLTSRAARDSLTKLLNRLGLVERLDDMIARSRVEGTRMAVVYLDIDGFKEVNDAYGHDTGDKLLNMVSDRMSAVLLGTNAAIARFGGDEFVFALPVIDEETSRIQIRAVLNELQHAYSIDNRRIQVGASLGVAVFPEDGAVHDDLLRNADLAMYAAKSAGRNNVVFFQTSLNNASAERIELRRDLAEAIPLGQLHLVYQPRVASDDLSNKSAEALLRWDHPTRGMVPPDRFISLAEDSGLIIDIGYWVLGQAIRQLEEWRERGDISIEQISVNLSPVQLMDADFLATVEGIMRESNVPASAIELEVTEGVLIRDVDTAVVKLKRLQELGFTIALDDFGVGYSAMSYLSVLPFDTLKIDKSFVSGFGVQKSAYAIASAIVALAKALNKVVVAEGVETQEQATILAELGVEELQGYYFSRPLKPADLVAYLQSRSFARLNR